MESRFSIRYQLAMPFEDKKENLPAGAVMAQEDNKLQVEILCKWNGNFRSDRLKRKKAEYIQSASICCGEFHFIQNILAKLKATRGAIKSWHAKKSNEGKEGNTLTCRGGSTFLPRSPPSVKIWLIIQTSYRQYCFISGSQLLMTSEVLNLQWPGI